MKRRILDLRPTQFSLGMLEVDRKVKEFTKLSDKKRRALMKEHVVPIIISPLQNLYLLDHHHFLCACWRLGIEKAYVEIKGDFSRSGLSYRRFWQEMKRSNWTFLFDQFGDGPRPPLYLPHDIRGLADDPYRSLAWLVRLEGGYEHTDRNFAEFAWANFFRKRRLLRDTGKMGLEKKLKYACRLARSAAARRLPGYLPKGSRNG